MDDVQGLTLDEYQTATGLTAIYPAVGENVVYTLLGLIGEVGELSEHVNNDMYDLFEISHGDIPSSDLADNVMSLLSEFDEISSRAEMLKKKIRDGNIDNYEVSWMKRLTKRVAKNDKIRKELGDAFWYLAQTATNLGVKLSKMARENLRKLFSRKQRGVLGGSGDER